MKVKNQIQLRIYEKIRVFQLEGPSYYLVYFALYLAREIIGKLLLSLIIAIKLSAMIQIRLA